MTIENYDFAIIGNPDRKVFLRRKTGFWALFGPKWEVVDSIEEATLLSESEAIRVMDLDNLPALESEEESWQLYSVEILVHGIF